MLPAFKSDTGNYTSCRQGQILTPRVQMGKKKEGGGRVVDYEWVQMK